METEVNLEVLNRSLEESNKTVLKDFKKVKYKLYPKLEDYSTAMSQFLNSYTFEKNSTVNRFGEDFHFFHLTTFTSNRIKHLNNVFSYPKLKIDKLGRDLRFCNIILSYILFFEMKLIQDSMQEMEGYRLYPIRWTHNNKEMKHIFLKIPKGEIDYFKYKPQECLKYTYEWFDKVLKEPIVVYKLGYKRFQISKDGKYLTESNNKLILGKNQMSDINLFRSYVILQSIKKIITMCHDTHANIAFFEDFLNVSINDPFWYFRSVSETSSNVWSNT